MPLATYSLELSPCLGFSNPAVNIPLLSNTAAKRSTLTHSFLSERGWGGVGVEAGGGGRGSPTAFSESQHGYYQCESDGGWAGLGCRCRFE